MSKTTTQQLIAAIDDDDECVRRDSDPAQLVSYTVKLVSQSVFPKNRARVEEILANCCVGAYFHGGTATPKTIVSFRDGHGDIQHIILEHIICERRGAITHAWRQDDAALEFAEIAHVVKYWMHKAEIEQLEDRLNHARERAAELNSNDFCKPPPAVERA